MDLLNNLKTDENFFNYFVKKCVAKKIKPSILTFLTPSANFFDIFRLIKLYELNKAGFRILLILQRSENKKESDFFYNALDKFIPNNKRVFLYEDIVNDLSYHDSYSKYLFSYRINDLMKFNKYPEIQNLSLSNINKFLTQYFILKNSQSLINQDPDFFLTTEYKDLFFNSIPNFDETKLPTKIILKNLSIEWNFMSSIKILERKTSEKKISSNTLITLKKALFSIEPLLGIKIKDKDFISIISEIKKFLSTSESKKECFVTKSDFKEVLSALNNKTRRKIISILVKKGILKAEEIRKQLNLNVEKKHTLASVIKHLNLLLGLKLIDKTNRLYQIKSTRVVLDLPFSWFSEE